MPPTFVAINHCVAAAEPGDMDEWGRSAAGHGFANTPETILKDDNLDDFALLSKTVTSRNGRVKVGSSEPFEVEKNNPASSCSAAATGPPASSSSPSLRATLSFREAVRSPVPAGRH